MSQYAMNGKNLITLDLIVPTEKNVEEEANQEESYYNYIGRPWWRTRVQRKSRRKTRVVNLCFMANITSNNGEAVQPSKP